MTTKIIPLNKNTSSSLLFDPGVYKLFCHNTYINYTFFPNYFSNHKIGVYTFIPDYSPQFIKSHFPQHDIEIHLISEWQFYQLLFMPYASPETDMILYPLLLMGVIKGASDIHLFATASKRFDCQFRIHGHLQRIPFEQLKGSNLSPLIKLHAHMNLSIQNIPQDGHILLNVHQTTHPIRVSSIPSYHGSDFVFRLFKKENKLKLSELGFSKLITKQLYQLSDHKSGLFLVTGPTGSGKSTTLYSILNQLKQDTKKNIVTLEDPIEYPLTGIRQSQINSSMNYTFSKGLRAILRQDPDIIMIGEIRDAETAKIAIEAAYTGHFVLATLHTHKCKDALLRLASFSIDPFFLTYTLKGILAQQLLPTSSPIISGEWLSPTAKTPTIDSYDQINNYVTNCLHLPFK